MDRRQLLKTSTRSKSSISDPGLRSYQGMGHRGGEQTKYRNHLKTTSRGYKLVGYATPCFPK